MADNLTTATIDVRANTRGLEKDILKALKTVELSEINTKKSSQALGRITGQVSEFNKSLEASNARVIAFGASAGAIFAVEKAFSSLISSTIQVEKKLTDINVLLGLSASTLQKFGDSLFGVAKNTAQSFSDVADAATELARQGLGIEETLKRTNAALILTRLSGLDAKSSVEALTATLNSFSSSALDAVDVVNKLANVDAAFAVSSADLANAISRVGSTAVDAGVSLDELIALVTSAQQTTARGGAVIGNSFKTIFTRLQRGKVQSLLESLGVDTSEGQSAISMLQQLATTYDTLGAAQKSYVAEQVGGVFQINILKAALSDLGKEYSIYGRALETSLSSTDQAIRRNELLNKTVSALSSQAYANLEQAASKIGSLVFEPNAKGFLSGINDLLSAFNNIDAESAGGKLMAGFFKGVGDFIGGPGAVLATAVLVKLFSRLTQFAAGSAKELLGTNKAAQQQAAIEQSILSILQKNSQFTSQILSGKMTTVQAEKELLNYLTAQSNILREQERLSKVIGTNLRMAGVSVGASGVPMVAAAGKGKKAAASGYVPNFAADQAIGQAMENAGAKEHGYKAGKAKKTRIHDGNGKSFTSFVNSKEDVKTFTNAAGKKATVVRPPNGFGENTQYAAGGFVPNFAKKKVSDLSKVKSGGSLKKLYDFQTSGENNSKIDYFLDNAAVNRIKLPYSSSEYDARSEKLIKKSLEQGKDLASLTYNGVTIGSYLSSRFDQSKLASGNKQGNISNIKGALGEIDTQRMLQKMGITPVKLANKFGIDFSYRKQSGQLQLGETKTTKDPVKDDVVYAKALTYIGRNAKPLYKGNKRSDTVDLSSLGIGLNLFESKASGFIPNFGKMQDLYKNTKMREGKDDPFGKRVAKANLAAKKGIPVKDLGSLPYTMIHAGSGGNFQASASYTKKDKKTNQQTQYLAKIWTAGLDQSRLGGANVQKRVGDALVTEANNLTKIFNPSGGGQFSNYSQLSNTGSVFSAAGTVFESAVRKAFNVSAQGQGDRIDFPNPSSELKSFFGNAPGPYEAKITNDDANRSSTLSKWVAINGLSKGYVPNFAKSSGLSFSQTKKDEFGFKELRAAIGGKNVGAFSYAEDKRGEVEIGDFTVDKKHRGKGYGTALYQEAIKRNKGKKMKGQLLPQMNRLLEKIKKGEPVSAETLYPQIKRADLAKSSVFEVYGHKGMAVENMTRDQFSSFVNAKINELKKDPKRLQSYFGNVEADEYGGLGIGLTTQHSSGFVPNFLDVTKGKLPIGVRGRTNYGSGGSKTNIQLGAGAEEGTLAHELFHSAYSRSTFNKAKSNDKIGKFISSPRKYAGSGALIGDQVFKNLNKNNLIKSVGLNPVQLDFDGKNPSASYSGEKAIDEIITRVQEKIFKNKGSLEALSSDEKTFAENLQRLGIISNKRLSNVSRHSKEGSRFRSLVENKFSSIASSGFVPNFASQSLISEINKRILNPNVAQKLKEGQGLKDEAYIKAASRLGVNTSGLESFIANIGFPLKGKESVRKVSSALGFGFGRSFSIDALKMGDWDYVKSSFEKNGLSKSDFDKLSQFAKTPKGESAFKWGFRAKAGGFVPNFANITSFTKDVRKKAHANQSSLNTFRVVHPLNPKIDAQGRVSFPDLEKIKGSAKIIHNEGMEGQNVFTIPSFLDFVNSRGNKQTFFRRNSFDYILSSAGYVPNFADALNDAISREQSAGLSKSQIYVDQHSSLKNKNNPMGLMVANTRDEPKGGVQGIKRAKKEGRNPKTYGGGMSSGYVPNFAKQEDLDELKSFTDSLKNLNSEIADASAKIKSEEQHLKKLQNELATGAFSLGNANKIQALNVENAKYEQAKSNNPQLAAGLDAKIAENNKKIIAIKNKEEETLKKEIQSTLEVINSNKEVVSKKNQELQSVEKNISRKQKEMSLGGRAKSFVSNNAMTLGFGLQAAAGSIGEMAGGESTKAGRRTGAVASMAGDIAGFAGTGAMIAGPYGALAGALVGAAKGATNLAKVWNSKVPDLEAALQASSDSLNRFGESGQKILQLNEQYADALTSGGDPAKAADIMAKTQEAYAEELSKLTDAQRASMISAIAQGKGQEEYAKILKQLSDKAKGDEGAATLAKFREDDSESLRRLTGGYMGQGDKKMLKGLDSDFAAMFSRGLDDAEIRTAIDVYSYSGDSKNTEYGKEQSALAVLNRLASSEKFSQDERDNFNNILNEFKATSEETDSSDLAEGILKGLEKILKGRADSKKNAEAVKKDTENKKKKEQQELALREAANARLLKIQAETESIFRKFNDGLDNFIGALEAASTMREAAGNFKAEYTEQSGANSYIVDKEKEKNLIRSNQDNLAIADLKNRKDSFNQFNAAIDDMLSGITVDAAKKGIQQTDLEQQNALIGTKLSLQNQLYGASAQVLSGDTDGAKATIDKVFENLTPEAKSQIDPGDIVKGIQELKNVADQSNKNSRDLVNNSRRDLGIQAQQLIFQKAMSRLNQAQNYGGSGIKDIIKDDPENAFNRAISALNDAKILGYNQKDLKQGKESAVNGSWQGKEKTTWGINGEKPNPAMSGAVIDFYKAAGEISGESVLSTDSKDFGALTQAVSESIRKKLNELKTAGDGVVDPAVFTRMESTLQKLGGSDKVSQLKIMKELGYANISGKKIMDEAMKGYSGGALEGMDPDLKAAYQATDDEGTAATLMMVAGQKKQTDSLLGGMKELGVSATIETNTLLSQQPQAIADALAAVLERGKKENIKGAKEGESINLGDKLFSLGEQKTEEQKKLSEAESVVASIQPALDKWLTKGLGGIKNDEKMLKEGSPELQKAKELIKTKRQDYAQSGAGGMFAGVAVGQGNEWDHANELVKISEQFQKFTTARDQVTKSKSTIEKIDLDSKDLESQQALLKGEIEKLTGELSSLTSVVPSLGGGSSSLPNSTASVAKGMGEAAGNALRSSTEQQLDAIKKSSSDYKITSRDGVKRTIEKDAMYEAGVSPINQKSLDKDTRLNRLHKAFQDIDSKNALPSYDNFKDVYSDLGGGEKEGKEMYESKWAEKFGGSMPMDEAVKRGVQDATSKASPALAEKKQGSGFLDWAKKEGKVPQDFQFTKEMRTGEQSLPENVAKAKQEFLSAFGVQTKGGAIASTTTDKGRIASAVKRTEADEANRKMFAKQDAAIEAMKPVLTGSRMVPDGKGKFKNVAAPGTPEESLRLAEYETAKKNAAFEKANFANNQAAGPISKTEAAIKGGADKALVAGQTDAVKKGIEEAANKSASKANGAEKKSGLSFVDWAKKEGKIPQDFKLTKEMRTGEQALPESVAKAKQEFLSSFGAQTKNGGAIASTTADKGRLVSAVKQTEADEANRKMFADQDAAIEAMKPTWTGSKMVPDGKGGFKTVAAPKQGEESIRQAEYETAKKNAAFEKANFANNQAAGPISKTEAAIQAKSGVMQPYGVSNQKTAGSPSQAEVPKLLETITSSMTRKVEAEDNKNTSPEQDPSQQILNSILASVNQIAQQIASTQEGGQQPAQGTAGGTVGSPQSAPSGGGGSGGVNVSTPVSLTVNTSAAQGTDAATAIAEQIKTGLSSFLSSPEFIGKVTSIANQAAGKVTPPTPPQK